MASASDEVSNSIGSNSRMRPAPGLNDSSDPVIGLDVGGQIFYTHCSTLTNGSSYFEARFGGSFGAENSVTDENGRDVYFIDASPELFKHILGFLRRGVPTWHKNIYRDDPVLFKRLISEAEYFGLDSMLIALRRPVIFEMDGSGKDVLYWLGTDGGGKEYNNPLDIGAVSLGGSCLELFEAYIAEESPEEKMDSLRSLKNFTQNRPLCGSSSASFGCPANSLESLWFATDCDLLHCEHSSEGHFLDITFNEISIRPTHYSLRYSDCAGMTCWNFQASIDGTHWITLHQSRNDKSIEGPSPTKVTQLLLAYESSCRRQYTIPDPKTKRSIATSIVEKELRGAWQVTSSNDFYSYFRLKGAGDECGENPCMHAAGFELYGEVEFSQSIGTLAGHQFN